MNRPSLNFIFGTSLSIKLEKSLSHLGLVIAFSAVFALWLNLAVSFSENGLTFPLFIFCLIFFLSLKSIHYGLSFFIFALPLLPGMPYQLSQFLNLSIAPSDAVGLELTLGFVSAMSLRYVWQKYVAKSPAFISPSLPWQLSLVLVLITASCCLAIGRNVWQSAAATSVYGAFFNLMHFRMLGWHEDFRPLFDWLSYGAVGSLVAFLVPILRAQEGRNSFVFRPILAALFLSSIWALVQSTSGIGGGIGFRRDLLGIPAFGFQPDLHAFAGYLLLGVIGLFGYLKCAQGAFEKRAIYLVIALSFVGLLLSKSRSMLMIGVMALLILFFINLWRRNRAQFYWVAGFLLLILASIGFAWYELAMYYKTDLGGFAKSSWGVLSKSSWVIQLALELSDRELYHFNELSIALGGRPEFYRAAARMLYFFPLLGIGVGSFYRLSIFEQLTASPTLRALGGENTHNYFLQTLTETGLIGGLIFAIAVIIPMLWAIRQKSAWPALFGLIGLFLGNLYAHSFLVRENFLLAAVLLALLYATPGFKTAPSFIQSSATRFGSYWKLIFVGVLLFFAAREVMLSFYRYPFNYGELCFAQKELTIDGWSSGFYQEKLPQGSGNLMIALDPMRTNIAKSPLGLKLDIIQDGVGILASKTVELNHNGPQLIDLRFASQGSTQTGLLTANLRLSSCFTPKNLGVSFDARRLGVLVKSVSVLEK